MTSYCYDFLAEASSNIYQPRVRVTVQRRASGAERSDAKRSEELYQKEVQQGKQSVDDSVGGFPTTPVSPLYGSSGLHP